MRPFSYARPTSLEAAAGLLGQEANAAIIAGGMTLVPAMKRALAAPERLVDLAGVAGLKAIVLNGSRISIGAMATHAEISADPLVRDRIAALAALAGDLGDPAVRARGTIGGSLAWNDPCADTPAAVLALDGTIVTDKRALPAEQFFIGGFSTALEPAEIITAITLPLPVKAAYAVYRGRGATLPLCGVFIAIFADAVRVAVTGVSAGGVFRWSELEQILMTSDDWSTVQFGPMKSEVDCLSTIHASETYRRHLAGVMACRAAAQLA